MHFFGQFKDHNSGRKHGNYTDDSIFSSTFSALTVCNIHFYISKWSKFIFRVPPLGLFSSIKYLNFGQKLRIHTFLESRHPEVTKKLYNVLFPKGNHKKISGHGLIPVCRRVSVHYLKINPPIFFRLLFSENYLNPQVRINKMVNRHTVD